ncbi:MAG: hypothetical protein ACYDDF_01235 [Thermoplasmatota archaeon]
MPKYETKLKLGRKLDDVSAEVASDNQVSVLFRFTETGEDKHVSLSIESDAMTVDDVAAVLGVLESRGVFTKVNTKTWVSQTQASEARFGKVREWQGVDIEGLGTRIGSMWQRPDASAAPVSSGTSEASAVARLREAERRVAELERSLAGLKEALRAVDV